MAGFGDTEKHIRSLFDSTIDFTFKNEKYTVIKCGKPSPSSGECKTDVYVLTHNSDGKEVEFKISIKQSNADFLENKITFDRAKQILGDNVNSILVNSIQTIRKEFVNDYMICFDKYKRTDAKSIKLGWKFEFLNKSGGDKSGKLQLSEKQKIDIYAGTNLGIDKKNCMVNGIIVSDSGIANYILEVDTISESIDYYLNKIVAIEDYAVSNDIYFACKALNYRVEKNKWDGNRPLCVYVRWSLNKDLNLESELIFDNPLMTRGNEVALELQKLLIELKISSSNFHELKAKLSENVKFHIL